jgi:uncharacterized membrane protein YccC
MNPTHRLPAYAINGATVAVGIAIVHFGLAALAGPHAAQLAVSGAVCASLADVPNTAARTWQRVVAAALLGFVSALLVTALRAQPITLGWGIAAIGFVATMTMAWGPRAGALSFAPILALVFAMALPPGAQPLWQFVLWNAAGAAAYLAWSLASGACLQRRYRTLALVETLGAVAELLRARAELLTAPPLALSEAVQHEAAMQAWVKGEAALADRLQTARDFVFDATDTAAARRDTTILLRAIELRDLLLASRLDLDLLGTDAGGRWILRQVAHGLGPIAQALDEAAAALRAGVPPPSNETLTRLAATALFDHSPLAEGDARARLLPALSDRLHNLGAEVGRIHALLQGATETSPLTREELQRFVAPEGFPLLALRAHRSGQSPVLRHALRSALALGSAYFIALALPWASHPHWLVLSVAVVLRGNLEQTLSRRNARVLGTLLGCVVVVALSWGLAAAWLPLAFLIAVAVAHAFVLQRYWLTATAATVMALLQSHSVDPSAGFAIGERVADTLLGALLAWGFSYVLPSWERRQLPQAIHTVLKALGDYAGLALSLHAGQMADAVELRFARRRAYDALGALAATLQRSAAEPKAVQLPVHELAALLDHGQRLMAHLSMVRLTLAARQADVAGLAQELADTRAVLAVALGPAVPPSGATGAAPAAEPADAADLSRLPLEPPTEQIVPWLLRRLQVLRHDAQRIRSAAIAARAAKPGHFG